ncbi:hypothetical protein NUW54_g13457 [Trametes sanguinea]|uniref:Uncharacterized protein n=1 Tax=Trametes sanguinea TaxID=158606 RepID=A0ACC1MKS7_9APHY|nr:hypothetical protein NUW54_g13457 [Trametes sanguinea]
MKRDPMTMLAPLTAMRPVYEPPQTLKSAPAAGFPMSDLGPSISRSGQCSSCLVGHKSPMVSDRGTFSQALVTPIVSRFVLIYDKHNDLPDTDIHRAIHSTFGYTSVKLLKDSDLCMVLDEPFDTLDLQNTWKRDVELGGFGNGEFQMTTDSSDNLYVQDGQLYIMPTLTSDKLGRNAILDGGSFDLGDACTTSNKTACSVKSSNSDGSTIQPVQSARISTMNSTSIAFGKVEAAREAPPRRLALARHLDASQGRQVRRVAAERRDDVGAFPPSHVPSH